MALRDDLLRELRFDAEDRARISNALFRHKLAVYTGTLEQLAAEHETNTPVLSTRIRRELSDEARDQADRMVDSYNAALRGFLDELDLEELGPDRALQMVEEWSNLRAERQAPVVAITSTYGPHADATAQFYRAAGLAPDFDFGGHGDAPPACGICAAILAGNPWTLEEMLSIGTPHPRCRQNWRARAVDVPSDYTPGQGGVAGIVGGETLIERAGDRAAAVAMVEAMR